MAALRILCCIDHPIHRVTWELTSRVSGWLLADVPIARIAVLGPEGNVIPCIYGSARPDAIAFAEERFSGQFHKTENAGLSMALTPADREAGSVRLLLETEETIPRYTLCEYPLAGAPVEPLDVSVIEPSADQKGALTRAAEERAAIDSVITELEADSSEPAHIYNAGNDPEEAFYARLRELAAPRILELGSREVVTALNREKAGPGASFVGLDIVAGKNVDIVGDAHELASLFRHESFDAVVSNAVFEHLAMPWKVALEINAILRPGGLVYTRTHHTYPLHEMPWDFWRYGLDAFPTIFHEGTGFRLLNHGAAQSAELLDPLTGERHRDVYLFAEALAEKTGPVDTGAYHWPVPLARVLPETHAYPGASTNLRQDMPAYRGRWTDVLMEFWFRANPGPDRPVLIVESTSSATSAPPDISAIRTTANRLYDALKGVEPDSLGGILFVDTFGQIPCPWALPACLNQYLMRGGCIAIADRQARPAASRPDYWRFSSESYRALLHPGTGFHIVQSVVDEPLHLFPHGGKNDKLAHDWRVPCFARSACVAVKRAEPANAECRWKV